MQKEDNKVIQYLEHNPMIAIAVLISFSYVLHTFFTRNQEVETIKYYLTGTTQDEFTDNCEDYFNTKSNISSSSIRATCNDLSHIVGKSNKETIDHAYEQERENYEYYKSNRECDPVRGC